MKPTNLILMIVSSMLINMSVNAQVWVNRSNASGDFSDKFNASMTDASGILYMAGYTMNPGANKDALLIKYNPATGDTIWTSIYNGPGSGADEALAMTIDNQGFIYITGFQKGSGTGNDFLTIKYDPSGSILWTATYNYPSNEYDQSNSIAVDDSGNVYIAGQSDSDPGLVTNDDFVLVKYDAYGSLLWAQRYNGFGNAIDRPSKILLDASSNIYVTGRSSNGFDDDYLTMKYNTTGTLLWSQLFDRLHSDRATDMVLNGATGVLYITGRSSNGNNYDYVTVKYNASGVQQWAKVYDNVDDDRATKIALDGTGNIYVTGQSDADASGNFNYNIVTIKYNPSGTQQWAKTYNGSGNNDDEPNALVVSTSGDVWIAGQADSDPSSLVISLDAITLHYNTAGTLLSSLVFNGATNGNDAAATLCLDGLGNTFIGGYSETNTPQRDASLIKYDNAGALSWQKFYTGIGDNSDNTHALTVDALDQVYVCGYMVQYGEDRNFATQKLDAAGNTVWTRTINGTSPGSIDDALSVATDPSGNVYASGYTKNSGTSSDFTTVKYLPTGDTAWVRYYNNDLVNESDRSYSLALDGNQNVYVTGRSDREPGLISNDDFLTIRYSSSGSVDWLQRYNGVANGNDAANVIRVSQQGNVFVSGKSFNGSDNDFCVIKYNASGQQQWVAFYNSTFGNDEPADMIVDANENVYVTGLGKQANGLNNDLLTVKFNATGTVAWAVPFNGAADGNDEGKGIVMDPLGNLLVTGFSDTDTSITTLNNNYCTIQFDGNGNQQWIRFYDGSASANDAATAIVSDNTGNVFVTGQSDNGSSGTQNYDFVTVKYTNTGSFAGSLVYNGTLNASDVANTLFIKNNDLYVSGGSYGLNSQRDMVIMKYDVTGLGISPITLFPGSDLVVSPNPVIETAVIQSKTEEIQLISITDGLGRSVKIPTGNTGNKSITLNCKNLTPGIYSVRVYTSNHNIKIAHILIP